MTRGMPYDEGAELAHYTIAHHGSLLSPFEQQVVKAGQCREKRDAATGESVRRKLANHCQLDNAAINAALCGGFLCFQLGVVRRILAAYPDLPINRCPQCNRVVRTPAAKQCLWCGHDWHATHD